jgi:hypothetical protein
MKRFSLVCVLFSILLLTPPIESRRPDAAFQQRWVWAICNLQQERQVEDFIALIERAGKCGFNGVVLSENRFNYLQRMPEAYFKNVARVRQAATAAGVEIIPCVFPIGSSNGLLVHDPNLAEGMEVRNAPFVVEGDTAIPMRDFRMEFINGGLEQASGHTFAGYTHQAEPGKITFADRDESHGGRLSCRVECARRGKGDAGLLAQRVRVRPNTCYLFSTWVKTRDVAAATLRLRAVGSSFGRPLNFHECSLPATQDWTRLDAAFNTFDETEVTVSVHQPTPHGGTLWFDDLALEELSLVNVLRRPGCPLTVTDLNDHIVYEEGKDFLPVHDDKLGQVPYAGEYDFRHAGPALKLTAGSRIADGQRLHVSWYHPVILRESQVMCCLAEPKVMDLLHDQAKRVNDLLKPKSFFLLHDETRVIGWCKACRDSRKTPGELLAANVNQCVQILKEINPAANVVLWSDMFDPYHNAMRSGYYFVNGPLTNSWSGLPREVMVANWNGTRSAESLKWFAEQGHAQILAGHYDGKGTEVLRKWWQAAQGVSGANGFMYTTFDGDYSQLEVYGKLLKGE